jgi:hypothetical protein
VSLHRPVQILLEIAVSALAGAALTRLARRAPARTDGWRRLAPSAMHWTALILSGGLFLFMFWIRLFVGSARHDAEHQMNMATGLIVAFGLGVAFCAWAIVRVRSLGFEWRGDTLAWRNGRGEQILRKVDDLASVRRSDAGAIRLSFADGESVKLDEHAQGCAELMEQLVARRPDLVHRSAR